MAIMPQADPELDGVDISGVCIPASEVGGDFFDYVRRHGQQRRLWVAVGDVAGKGMPAAMTAVMSDGMLIAEIGQGGPVEHLLTSLNRPLYDKVSERIFTALCVTELDGESGTVTFANAGLSEPLLRQGEAVEYLSPPGPHLPLGAFGDTRYQSRSVNLATGDVLVVFSDGLPEARSPAGELYGYDALRGLVARLPVGSLTADEIRDAILADVRRFAGRTPQSDDITLVVVKRTGGLGAA
jgi:serine phosphatase RsbU (regulator of sigma subunit)